MKIGLADSKSPWQKGHESGCTRLRRLWLRQESRAILDRLVDRVGLTRFRLSNGPLNNRVLVKIFSISDLYGDPVTQRRITIV